MRLEDSGGVWSPGRLCPEGDLVSPDATRASGQRALGRDAADTLTHSCDSDSDSDPWPGARRAVN